MARSLEIPAVVGTETITKDVKDGDMLIADGLDGDAIINPTDAQIEEYTKKGEAFAKQNGHNEAGLLSNKENAFCN